ncbi:MAG: NADH-quinone oxidoreductase subunit NuoH [Verrucomicrobia bacterium]|nr:NADH-quinone oxidoreductase subunit NuoH [Verrucomicrobiota bacterium]MBI3869975.1 NADH-quinone oxidoreductase subunit NuoH [Verrucomicrobiota bacterium]
MLWKTVSDQPDPKAAFLPLIPEEWRSETSVLLSIAPLMMIFPALFALTTVVERKGLGRIQNRLGPNRVGPAGFLQFAADGLKTLTKEDIVPRAADQLVHFLAPLALVVPVFLTFSVLPFGRHLVPLDLESGLLFFFAIGAATELSVFMAGWASRNKYSLLGALRAVAQMVSYEIPLILSALTVVMATGTLSLPQIVDAQAAGNGEWLARWHVFTPWGFFGFALFLVAACAEANRAPFDLPEGESEIIAGYYLEYSGFKFALFFLGEYLGLFAACGLGITLFLGGWHAPLPILERWIPSYAWFFAKLAALIGLFIWVRGTLPRVRMDQLMNLAWKFMLPLALVNLLAVALWHFLPNPLARWAASSILLAGAYVGLGRALMPPSRIGKRVYRYAPQDSR